MKSAFRGQHLSALFRVIQRSVLCIWTENNANNDSACWLLICMKLLACITNNPSEFLSNWALPLSFSYVPFLCWCTHFPSISFSFLQIAFNEVSKWFELYMKCTHTHTHIYTDTHTHTVSCEELTLWFREASEEHLSIRRWGERRKTKAREDREETKDKNGRRWKRRKAGRVEETRK